MKRSSPTVRLLLGLLITLAAVTSFSLYTLQQFNYLRRLQTETIDLNRHDSLLLIRVQNAVNTLGLKLQEMTEGRSAARIARYRGEFNGVRADLEAGMNADRPLAMSMREPSAQQALVTSLHDFWTISDEVFEKASTGDELAARNLAATRLSDQQIILARRLSNLLEDNNNREATADATVASVYASVVHQTYLFLAATMAAILITTLYLIYSNRRIFERLESLSRQRRVLAARLITVQEEVLRSVSRELHDEFGQILTAVSAMLSRAERKGLPPDSPFRTELSEVREITHNTLEKMRSLSQMLHPSVLDDYGLAKGIEWYTELFQRQTGIQTSTHVTGNPVSITGQPATHCFRIVQEALTNAAKHSRSTSAEVLLTFLSGTLKIQIRDFGSGIAQARKGSMPGLGLVAMRERAEILSGELTVDSVPGAGTTISLVVPLRQDEDPEIASNEDIGEVVTHIP
jgi:signal transduction histidine kinase